MSAMTVPKFSAAKQKGRKLAMLTAYDFTWASIVDAAGVDAILVGDTLGMVVQGNSTTLPVTIEEMIYHGKMVVRGTQNALVIVDLPFLSYQISPEQAIANAGRILKETGAAAVKLEGGVSQANTIAALTNADIPVMAHVGFKPQSIRAVGSMGKIQRDEDLLLADAKAAEAAGAFGIVLEMISSPISARITKELQIPTIGIGAGPECDGQVLVLNDMLGLTEGFKPKFLKHYANLHEIVTKCVQNYANDVREGTYPDADHSHQ
ncbi:3-methyl-2-oxobutanoate hydroxymethyltransferase [Rubinisphaera sp.]|uniref:3-methyl-2-oxobutanoate hydroxymethyltransferase n=1 Tax=Rubinisphaera sp. TaxID=2024857 RepID=UPI000C0F0AB8|nr:3-methyl-2-oxobutanoate hydroxymethyltransferase [Rubinisphaera sp.]MBV10534.1 3-methyl-2-oxobutanoate hydroxymethyltransferase [Rubinisphaera sp.]HCS55127.1 3-methyl-2-oxobutanoate hydroxymethyltransferase [Planctomycetaceae bacterium]|tara:strand:+ start:2082 stop:2873 length:792 start_codon:yes stop_codon:yes gene_type:complete